MESRAQALRAVMSAFADVERPLNEDLLHPQCMDDGDLLELYEVSDWREMTDEQVVRNYAALSFLSAAGFRYFLPAFLSYGLRDPDTPEVAVESAIFHLDPGQSLRDFAISKFELLDEAQRGAIRQFLEAMRGHHDVAGSLSYWADQ